MEIKQRVPNYIDLGPDHEFPVHIVNTIEELHALEFVQRWMGNIGAPKGTTSTTGRTHLVAGTNTSWRT